MAPKFLGNLFSKHGVEPAVRSGPAVAAAAPRPQASGGPRPQGRPAPAARPAVVRRPTKPEFGAVDENKTADEGDDTSAAGPARQAAPRMPLAVGNVLSPAILLSSRKLPGDAIETREAAQVRRFIEPVPVDATEEDVRAILGFNGEVLTVSNAIETTNKQRLVCAFLSNGWLLVDKSKPMSADIMQVQADIRRLRREIKTKYLVDLSVIRKVNERGANNFGVRTEPVVSGMEVQEFQKEFLNLIGSGATRRVSDIHIIVDTHETKVEFRVNGAIEQEFEKVSQWGHSLCQAAFAMADNSDAVYKLYEPQGARVSNIRVSLPSGVQSVRLQFNPLQSGGRNLVCRLLYENSNAAASGGIEALGYEKSHVFNISQMRKRPYGINIIAGPTGSGKSTTLVRMLATLIAEKRGIKVITIEDPPEYVIPGAVQMPVNGAKTAEERNEAFRRAITAALRSDPDVIMIGEIRDAASAKLAFEAASTGHQVYASLHANNALAILARLRDIGVPMYNLCDHDTMTGLIGQRLIRKLCTKCKRPFNDLTAAEKERFDPHLVSAFTRIAGSELGGNIHVAQGCKHCDRGIAGREVIAETINPDETLMELFAQNKTATAVRHWQTKLNGLTMREHAIQKMCLGLCDPTDVEEVIGNLDLFEQDRRDIVLQHLFPASKGAN